LAKKNQKPNPPAGGLLHFFITQNAYAIPPKKMQFALFRQKPPHNYQSMIDDIKMLLTFLFSVNAIYKKK
jgi:hypothetical protein